MDRTAEYQDYRARYEEIEGRRKKLDEDEFHGLNDEYKRLCRAVDPADIQLDEWKRLEELRFLLIESGDDDDDT